MYEPIPPEALLAGVPTPIAAIADRLRTIVRSAVPESIERVRTGWRLIGYDLPVGGRTVYFAWIWPEAVHVHLGFPKGTLLDDPDGVLQGTGITKAARWFTLHSQDEVAPRAPRPVPPSRRRRRPPGFVRAGRPAPGA